MDVDSKIIFYSILNDNLSPVQMMDCWRMQIGGVRKALNALKEHGLISDPVTTTEKGDSLQAFLWAHTDLTLEEAFAVPDHMVRSVARAELLKQGNSGSLREWMQGPEIYRETYR